MIFKRIINLGFNDRVIRFGLATLFFLLAFFWFSGVFEFLFYFIGILLYINSITGICRIYKVFGIYTCKNERVKTSKYKKHFAVIIIIVIFLLGSYFSIYYTNKIFLRDFDSFNTPFRQALVYTAINNPGRAVDSYSIFKLNFYTFKDKYRNYKPFSVRYDERLDYDFVRINSDIKDIDKTIGSNNLTIANKQLKEIDFILGDILKRNGF